VKNVNFADMIYGWALYARYKTVHLFPPAY